MNYRYLKEGETILAGDEFLYSVDDCWYKAIDVGLPLQSYHRPHRRMLIEPAVDYVGIDTDRATELAEAHWSYVQGVLEATSALSQEEIDMCAFHYISAFEHGYKHAREDCDAR